MARSESRSGALTPRGTKGMKKSFRLMLDDREIAKMDVRDDGLRMAAFSDVEDVAAFCGYLLSIVLELPDGARTLASLPPELRPKQLERPAAVLFSNPCPDVVQ